MDNIKKYLEETEGFSPEEIIAFSYKTFGSKISFASSLGQEDQVITDMISQAAPQMVIFTLDTGRLFPETYALIDRTQKRYAMPFKVYYPDASALEDMVQSKGINLFYESIENRKLCCGIRKIEPLKRALADVDAWMCGLRSAQSITRTDLKRFEWDEGNQKIKINPLADWSLEQVRDYISKNEVDMNPLHTNGFVSIGCAPCTRPVDEGDDIRSGRWWWESAQKKECGLHNNPNRKST